MMILLLLTMIYDYDNNVGVKAIASQRTTYTPTRWYTTRESRRSGRCDHIYIIHIIFIHIISMCWLTMMLYPFINLTTRSILLLLLLQGQLNLYDEFEKRTTATKITLIRKKPSSSSTAAAAAVSSQAPKPKKTAAPQCGKGKRKRRSAPAKLEAVPPVVVVSSSRRRGRLSVDVTAAGESPILLDADADVDVPMAISSDRDLQSSCASAPPTIQQCSSRGRALSADDDFADIYDSDGYYDSSSANRYHSNEDHLHNEDGNGAEQSNSTLDEPMDLQQEGQPIGNPSLDL